MYDPEQDARERRRSPWTAAYRAAQDEGLTDAEAREYAAKRVAELNDDRAEEAALRRHERRMGGIRGSGL